MAQQIQEAKATYEELETRENIRIKVPKEGPYMTQIDGHTLKVKDQSLTVDSHWQNGMPPDQERKFLIQRNFFGFDRKELGGKHNATVKVTRKVTPGGWNVLLLDITKQDGRPTKTLKLRIGDDIPIELRPFHEAPVHLDFA